MKNMTKIEIPFNGFYESLHDAEIERALEDIFDVMETGEPIENYSDLVWEISERSYKEFREAYSKLYMDLFCAEFMADYETGNYVITSPREYNFETDRLFLTVSNDFIKKVIEEVDRDTLNRFIIDRCTSYDGFSSYYSNDIDQWIDILEFQRDPDLPEFNLILCTWLEDHKEYDPEYWNCWITEDIKEPLQNEVYEIIERNDPGVLIKLNQIHDFLKKEQ